MKRRGFLLLLVLIPLLLAACDDGETTLVFDNQTECGSASIEVTNTEAGSVENYTLAEGEKLTVKISPAVTYRYAIQYEGRPDARIRCEAKSGTVMVPNRGQDSTFRLVAVTPTPPAG
ncbi:MAG: hypothetical protein GXY36_11310 [Chloroflexi bacterium]|nr:hypothetical protein [Chloroflexota bacterium]